MEEDKKHLNKALGRPGKSQFPKAEELLEHAFNMSSKLSVSRKGIPPMKVIRNLNGLKIKTFGKFLQEKIADLSKQMPKMDELDPFYLDLVGAIVDTPRLKQNLARLNASAHIIKKLRYMYGKDAYAAASIKESNAALNAFQGRVSSIMKKLRKPMNELREDSKKLRELPTIDFALPTMVLAGCPNVGKTTLLKRLTGSKAEIAPFPFTTKHINTGYFELKYRKVQVLDTPGLLDRADLNPIERKALAAIKHVAKAVVFIIDPTLACGFPLEQQVSLLKHTHETFPDKKTVSPTFKVLEINGCPNHTTRNRSVSSVTTASVIILCCRGLLLLAIISIFPFTVTSSPARKSLIFTIRLKSSYRNGK